MHHSIHLVKAFKKWTDLSKAVHKLRREPNFCSFLFNSSGHEFECHWQKPDKNTYMQDVVGTSGRAPPRPVQDVAIKFIHCK